MLTPAISNHDNNKRFLENCILIYNNNINSYKLNLISPGEQFNNKSIFT